MLRDYLRWRQADCHINCQYNTTFWALVGDGTPRAEAQALLAGTDAAFKNELLFSRFGLSYASLPPLQRRGSVLVRERLEPAGGGEDGGDGAALGNGDLPAQRARVRSRVAVLHTDIMGEDFWAARPRLLAEAAGEDG